MKYSPYLRRYHFFDDLPPMPRWVMALLALLAAWWIGTSLAHVFTEVINWDEFAMLERAERTHRFGKVIGDGRPGLVSIILIPFVRDCVDSALSVVRARLLWQGITLLYLVGVYFLVRRWFTFVGRAADGRAQGILAVALLAFLPSFVVWSVQVRSDQAALATIVWGGALLLSKSGKSALAAGILFGIGLLCTQKGVYVIGLVGLLYLLASRAKMRDASDGGPLDDRAVLKHLGLTAASTIAVITIYFALVPEALKLADPERLSAAAGVMQYSRVGQGYRIYTVHAHRLLVHWILFGALLGWTIRCLWVRDRDQAPLLAASWLCLLMGVAVIMVHGSAFPYFIMTAGLFPALALAISSGGPLALAGRSAWPIIVSMVALCAAQSSWESVEMLADTQKEQHDTLRLVTDSPLKARRGYHLEGALLCMRDPDPFPVLFSPGIYQRFYASPSAAKNRADFIAEFRKRPVAYVVETYRLAQFPEDIREFLSNHYVWYAHSLYVVGYNFDAEVGQRNIDVIVGGKYRWDADPTSPTAKLIIGSRTASPGEIVTLPVGTVRARIEDETGRGQLILADLPRPNRTGYPFFYLHRQIEQLGGVR